ncbi:MAG: hypothetical protein DYG83_15020 [Candidatus Brocadia sp. AMX2]|nr:MAG: hypothetical protein EDM70_14340 [Candidatus Brocadia sp. AMX2]MBC6933799.1 hypothetical protein [Candidatus Brocadia sp.]MBL1170555.1 hypothetical protein [Candidatus Brocadia sp. AMX1]NOG42080.1 hypothetical protein [Planctomycetota bacterium]MCE7868103.1 hypothetical protein [Candidatus Brocadia sp. AMX2]
MRWASILACILCYGKAYEFGNHAEAGMWNTTDYLVLCNFKLRSSSPKPLEQNRALRLTSIWENRF